MTSSRNRLQWSLYNLFFRKGEVTGRNLEDAVAAPTVVPEHLPHPPIMPVKPEWREAVMEGSAARDDGACVAAGAGTEPRAVVLG
ncbi:MAG: hypothetical protein ACYS5V_15570 [Planctomycetota bacterium]